jgi:predicted Zn-dependent protease
MEINSPGRLDRNKDMTARALTEAEAEFYLGDMLLRDNRLPEAEARIQAALRLDPRLAAAQVAMGQLLIRQTKDTDAVPYLERAVQLDPKNHLAHYYYAATLQSPKRTLTDTDVKTARAELLKAIELAPQFVVATELLGNLNLATNIDIPQTIELLKEARTFAPANDNLAVMLAFALLRTPQRDEARALAESVMMKDSLSPTMRKNAETILASLSQKAGSAATDELGVPEGAATVSGILTSIDCRNGAVTLSVTVDGKTAKFHSARPNRIQFTTSVPSLSSIGCGPLPGGGVPAVIAYLPEDTSDSLGEPLAVELGNGR